MKASRQSSVSKGPPVGVDKGQQEEKVVIGLTRGIGVSLAVLLAVGAAACAPQQNSPAAASARGASGSQASPGQAMSGMHGGHSMGGMDHQAMMTHCAQMRQSVQQGARLSSDMQQMMTQCDQMDRSMGSQRTR